MTPFISQALKLTKWLLQIESWLSSLHRRVLMHDERAIETSTAPPPPRLKRSRILGQSPPRFPTHGASGCR